MKPASFTAWALALERIATAPPPVPHREARAAHSRSSSADPSTLTTPDHRIDHIADLIVAGEWRDRKTAKELATIWGVKTQTVFDYASQAARITRADRGTREHARELSLGRWSRVFDDALSEGDYRGAAAAEKGWDLASGVTEPGGAKVQVNVLQHPDVMRFYAIVMDAVAGEGDAALTARIHARVRAARALLTGAAPVHVLASASAAEHEALDVAEVQVHVEHEQPPQPSVEA
jgi:hypothetical protein